MEPITVHLPNGQKIVFPAGTAPDVIEREAQQHIDRQSLPMSQPPGTVSLAGPDAAPPTPGITVPGTIGRGLMRGALMNFDDEIKAGVGAVAQAATQPRAALDDGTGAPGLRGTISRLGNAAADVGALYDAELNRARALQKGDYKDSPWIAGGSEIAGTLATLPLMPAKLVKPAASFWGNVGKNMLTGAGYGGASSFGGAEGGFIPRLQAASIGAPLGAAVGGALTPVAALASLAASNVAQSTTGQAAGRAIGSGLNKAADVVESFAPKVPPPSLSAAGVPGATGLPVEGTATTIAEILRNRATGLSNTVEAGAYDRLAQAVLKAKIDPARAADDAAALGQGTLADLSGRTLALAKDSFVGAPGVRDYAKAVAKERDAGIGPQIVRAFEGPNSPPTMNEAARFADAYARNFGRELYDPLRRVAPEVSPRMTQMLENTPALQTSAAKLEADAAKYNKPLTEFDKMAGLKRQLQDDAIASARGTDSVNMGYVKGLAKDWKNAWHDANPWVREADATYQGRIIEPFGAARDRMAADGRPVAAGMLDKGYQFLRTSQKEGFSPDEFARVIPQASNEAKLAARVGAVNAVRDRAFAGPKATRRLADTIDEAMPVPGYDNVNLSGTIDSIFGKEAGANIRAQAAAIRRKGETDRRVTGGSETALNLIEAGNLPALANPQGGGLVDRAFAAYNALASRARSGNEASREAIMPLVYNTDAIANAQTMERIAKILAQMQAPGAMATPAAAPLVGATGTFLAPRVY